jgi:uncharacterized protein DUF5677
VLSGRERQGDLGVLARCLFEHVVMLAWLTGSPDQETSYERLLLWQRYDDEHRLKVDREVSALQGHPLLSAQLREDLEAAIDAMEERRLPGVADRALVADREWDGRVGVSLRDQYSILYRPMSTAVHPTTLALSFQMTDVEDGKAVHAEPRNLDGAAGTLGGVLGMLMNALVVSSYTFNRPAIDAAEAALDWLLGDEDGELQ